MPARGVRRHCGAEHIARPKPRPPSCFAAVPVGRPRYGTRWASRRCCHCTTTPPRIRRGPVRECRDGHLCARCITAYARWPSAVRPAATTSCWLCCRSTTVTTTIIITRPRISRFSAPRATQSITTSHAPVRGNTTPHCNRGYRCWTCRLHVPNAASSPPPAAHPRGLPADQPVEVSTGHPRYVSTPKAGLEPASATQVDSLETRFPA